MRKIISTLLIAVFIVGTSTGYSADNNLAQNDNTEFNIHSVESATIDNVINTTFEAPAVNMEVKQLIANDLNLVSIYAGPLEPKFNQERDIEIVIFYIKILKVTNYFSNPVGETNSIAYNKETLETIRVHYKRE